MVAEVGKAAKAARDATMGQRTRAKSAEAPPARAGEAFAGSPAPLIDVYVNVM
jgi:hypothetical protein